MLYDGSSHKLRQVWNLLYQWLSTKPVEKYDSGTKGICDRLDRKVSRHSIQLGDFKEANVCLDFGEGLHETRRIEGEAYI